VVRGRVQFPGADGIRHRVQAIRVDTQYSSLTGTIITRTTFQLYHLLPRKRRRPLTWQEITFAKALRERSHLS
jgi:hypothetical protein